MGWALSGNDSPGLGVRVDSVIDPALFSGFLPVIWRFDCSVVLAVDYLVDVHACWYESELLVHSAMVSVEDETVAIEHALTAVDAELRVQC